MTYTLSWKTPAGGLCETSLGYDDLVATLPGLRAPATVVDELGRVCGEVREKLTPDFRRQLWHWHLRPSQG